MPDPDATALIRKAMPLCESLGIAAESFSKDEVVLSIEWLPELCTTAGMMHGGVLMALADSAGGAAASLNLPADASGTSTIESKTNFFGSVKRGTVTATARPLHKGSTTIVVETEVHAGKRLVAKVTQTQAVLTPRE